MKHQFLSIFITNIIVVIAALAVIFGLSISFVDKTYEDEAEPDHYRVVFDNSL